MKVNEIFRSIQGEGINQGRPCTFIRFAGCNLDCAWCDTRRARSEGEEMDRDTILGRVRELGGRYICITGGEPLLQGPPLLSLVQDLFTAGCTIDIETNGTLDFSLFQPYAGICMDVKCPSSGERSNLALLPLLSGRDAVKFVVRDLEDCKYAAGVMRTVPHGTQVFFSPVGGTDPLVVARFLIREDLPARLQLQLHKVIGVS
ncbi:MAG: radical SAM protein [Methanolinea sp.]|nr:radical SAM protein [Methanolinea sp.]